MAGSFDSTQALLDYTIQDSCLQDSSEDEVFFGQVHTQEKKGRSKIRHDTTIDERDFSPVKISQQLDRSHHSLLSADNSIPEESEEEDIEEERRGIVGGERPMSTSSSLGERKGTSTSTSSGARSSQAGSGGWETQSETSGISSLDATEMEISVEISGIVPPGSRKTEGSFGGFDAVEKQEFSVNGEEEMVRKAGEGAMMVNEEEEYLKDIQFLAEKEAVDEDSDEEVEDTSQCSEQGREVEKPEFPARELTRPPQVWLTRPSNEWSRSDFRVQGGVIHLPEAAQQGDPDLEDSRPGSQMSHRPEETSTRSVYHTAPSSPRRSEAPEPCFDTTADEMILFEMFGDCYDEKVEAMSTEEKRSLQEELKERKERESVSALKARMLRLDSMGSIASTVSPFSLASPSCTPSPRHPELLDQDHEKPIEEMIGNIVEDSLQRRLQEEQENELKEKVLQKQREERLRWEREDSRRQKEVGHGVVERAERGTTPRGRKVFRDGEAAYTQHTQASLFRQVSPSPKKTPTSNRPAWVPASPIPGRELALSPVKPLGLARPPSRIPQPVMAKPLPALRVLKAAQVAVSSPVAEYVKNNPAPHLVRNVVAKEAARPLDSTLMEVEGNKENLAAPACPLPANTYTSAHLFQETRHAPAPVREYRYIPEAYGLQGSAEASVTKHLSRKKLDQEQLQTSESMTRAITPKSASSLEVSLLETKVVRKFATPLRKTDPNV